VFLALGVVAGAALWLQRQAAAQLRGERALLREEHASLARLRAENATLAAARPSAGERERLRADHAAAARLRGEIESLKAGVETREDAFKPKSPAGAVSVSAARVEAATAPAERVLAAAKRKNAGRATPLAALETLLWAGANGDLTILAPSLAFDREAAQRARELFDGLPEAQRREYGSPHLMVATLMAKDMPAGDARVTEVKSSDSTAVRLEAELKDKDGDTSSGRFEFVRNHDGTWLLQVPVAAVEHLVGAAR